MADISIHLDRADGRDTIKKLEQVISQVNFDDELTISLAATDAHHSDEVTDLLAKNHFDYQPIGSHNGKEYIITARKTVKRTKK